MHHNRMGRVPPSSTESERMVDRSDGETQVDSDSPGSIEAMVQGLTPDQLNLLAHKVYALLLDEVRLDDERAGRRTF